MPELAFYLGQSNDQYKFILKPEQYLKYNNSTAKCELLFRIDQDTASTSWTLGLPFFKAFYTVFDLDELKVGFAGNV